MAKDYYIILGVGRGASLGQIKHAYRRMAKQLHPDLAPAPEGADKFMEAKEAYDTLADAEKRRRYDDELRRSGSPLRIARVPEIVRDRSRAHDALAQAGSFVDEFLEGFLPGFPSRRRFRSPEKEIYLQVILSPRESREGGLFPIRFPVRESCPECGSAGLVSDFFCASCFGRGYVSAEREFSLSIPPRTGSGTAVSLSLEDIGLRGVRLLVEVLVDPLLKD